MSLGRNSGDGAPLRALRSRTVARQKRQTGAVAGMGKSHVLGEPSVRPFRASDAQSCCDVVNAAIVEMDGLNEAARRHIVGRNTPEVLGTDLAAWTSIVVEADGLGVVAVGALDGSEIKRVYVDPRAQGLGAGRALLEVLEAEATRSALAEVRLDASPSSVAFYTSHGYEAHADGGFAIGAAEFSFVTMTKTL